MGLWELFVIALGLSMDAFAVSICKGLSVRRCTIRHMLICGLYFGLFQGAMPLIGYLLGSQFESLVTAIAPYIAFVLLAIIGFNMIRESKVHQIDNVIFSSQSMGMRSMDADILRLYRAGRISREDALLYSVNSESMREKLV